MNIIIKALIIIGELTINIFVLPYKIVSSKFTKSSESEQKSDSNYTPLLQTDQGEKYVKEEVVNEDISHKIEKNTIKNKLINPKLEIDRTYTEKLYYLYVLIIRYSKETAVKHYINLHNNLKALFKTTKINLKVLQQSFTNNKLKISASSLLFKLVQLMKQIVIFILKIFYLSLKSNFKYFYIGFFSCLLFIFIYQSYTFVKDLPSPKNIGKTNFPLSSHIYDRNDKLLYEIYSSENRTPVKIDSLPKYIPQATIAIEDKDFFKHLGISPVSGILRALKDTYKTKELQGGSTITQQLVKSSLLTPERTIQRKLKEMILALWSEKIYTKKNILEMYLNQVPYGGSSYGIEEASENFFGKTAKEINLSEAALLAGLPRAPSIYSPYINPKLAENRRNQVLKNMYEQGYISKKQKEEAQQEALSVIPPRTNILAPHFVFYAKSKLEEKYGIKKVEEGGLKIKTTIDLDIQQEAQKIVKEEVEKLQGMNISNAAALVTNPKTGEILAMVGSTDYFAAPSGSFNVTTALRQPGSTIKPIMYSLALQNGGYTAASIIQDKPIVYRIEGAPDYKPVNYDHKYRGPVTLRFALSNSLNIPAVKVLDTIGVQNFANHAKRMGIDTWNDPTRFGLSLTLGGVEVTMLDMAEAFGVFSNKGYRVNLNYMLKARDPNKEIIYNQKENTEKVKVLNEGVAYIISNILSDNKTRETAFGPNSALVIPERTVAVKTGTTNDVKDNWTIGFTPEFLVATWVGNNDNTAMNRNLVSGITGAAPIWNRIMTYLIENKSSNPEIKFEVPNNVISKDCMGRTEYFVAGTENISCRKPVIRKQQPEKPD